MVHIKKGEVFLGDRPRGGTLENGGSHTGLSPGDGHHITKCDPWIMIWPWDVDLLNSGQDDPRANKNEGGSSI